MLEFSSDALSDAVDIGDRGLSGLGFQSLSYRETNAILNIIQWIVYNLVKLTNFRQKLESTHRKIFGRRYSFSCSQDPLEILGIRTYRLSILHQTWHICLCRYVLACRILICCLDRLLSWDLNMPGIIHSFCRYLEGMFPSSWIRLVVLLGYKMARRLGIHLGPSTMSIP